MFSHPLSKKREEVMKRLRTVLGGVLVFGFLAMIPVGCSDSDSATPSATPTNLSTRVNVLSAENGTLSPVVQSSGRESVSATDQSWEYTLTLENVSEQVLWYTDRPGRESGSVNVQTFVAFWLDMYGDVPPNTVLDGFTKEELLNDGLYLRLEKPVYDSGTNRLTFQVTLLATTMDDKHPDIPINIDNIKMTVLNNSPEGETDNWSFAQASPEVVFESTGTDGVYKLNLNDVYSELYQVQNAPGSDSATTTATCLADNWNVYFSSAPPNASLSAYTVSGESGELGKLELVVLELDNPSYQDNVFSYDATVLSGNIRETPLFGATLLIDSPDVRPVSTLSVTNTTSSPVDVWVSFGANSCVKQADIPGCKDAPYDLCTFNLTASGTDGATKVIPPKACPMNLTFRFDSIEGCGTTKAEANINYPNEDDFWNVSLVDGWNRNVKIDVITADGSTKTLGPPNGKTGNENVFGVYPLNCDICVAIQKPNCPVEGTTDGCKVDVNGEHIDPLRPKVPCQWNSPGQNQVTINILD